MRIYPMAMAVTALAALTACVTVLPETKPVRLYSFVQASTPTTDTQRPLRVRVQGLSFTTAAASDRILTVTGSEQAYIADARWVSPAPALFRQALENALNGDPRTRLWTSGETNPSDIQIMVDVVAFETRYDHGLKASPIVSVAFNAVQANGETRRFSAEFRADDNRQSAIVDAYGRAVSKCLIDLDNWIAATRP